MGVTFTATTAITGYQMICCDGEHRDTRMWPADASIARIEREHAASCVDPTCIDYQGGILEPIYAAPIEPVEVGQVNARRVLDALGYPTSPDGIGSSDPFEPFDNATGEAGAEDFAGRVLTALALSPDDEGMPVATQARTSTKSRRSRAPRRRAMGAAMSLDSGTAGRTEPPTRPASSAAGWLDPVSYQAKAQRRDDRVDSRTQVRRRGARSRRHRFAGSWPGAHRHRQLVLVVTDIAMPGTDEYGSRGARWVECGRRPGYLQDILGRLRSLAEVARAHDLTITWA